MSTRDGGAGEASHQAEQRRGRSFVIRPPRGRATWRLFGPAIALRSLRDITYSDPIRRRSRSTIRWGACETCRGFGRVIGVDLGLVIPDEGKTLGEGPSNPGKPRASKECLDDLKVHDGRNIPMDVPFRDLGPNDRRYM